MYPAPVQRYREKLFPKFFVYLPVPRASVVYQHPVKKQGPAPLVKLLGCICVTRILTLHKLAVNLYFY
jgi:hypothetical protein